MKTPKWTGARTIESSRVAQIAPPMPLPLLTMLPLIGLVLLLMVLPTRLPARIPLSLP
ncbi:MAG: hypothetical protein HN842_02410 [Gammaproteobacteria bacterium]|nr:hypothetical protein [Gammaproteobacteria bacterium]